MKAFGLIEHDFWKGQGKILDFCAKLSRSAVVSMCSRIFPTKNRRHDRICHRSVLWQTQAKRLVRKQALLWRSFMIENQCNSSKQFRIRFSPNPSRRRTMCGVPS